MLETLFEKEEKISKFILGMKNPFTKTELYECLKQDNISTDKELILDILGQLYENGLINGVEMEDGTWKYRSNWQ